MWYKRRLVGLFSVGFHNSDYMKVAHEKDVQAKKKDLQLKRAINFKVRDVNAF